MTDPSVVTAPCGTVRGASAGGVRVFRGIPYAVPPVGALRFAPPLRAPSAEQIDATRFGPVSLQDVDPLPVVLPGTEHHFYAPGARADEDCLSLNVWAPDGAEDAPVYVYIHGGGFLCGSGTGGWIDGTRLAREHGIVVVTINYRLGLLGSLWLGDHDPRCSDLAIQDDIQALGWVQDNVQAFGGDPGNVTVGGESAGALSVLALLCAPDARGLFHRAVVESGHLDLFQSVEDARHATATVLADLSIDPGDDVLARLRETSVFRIAQVQRTHGIALRCFPLVADDVILDGDPVGLIAQGGVRDIDLLIGSNAEEDRLFRVTGWAASAQTLAEAAEPLIASPSARALAVELYERLGHDDLAGADIGSLMATDHDWTEPVRATAGAHAAAGGRTYHYELAWASSVPRIGAAHLVDLPFFFGNLDGPGVDALLGGDAVSDPATVALAEKTSASLARFVRTGDLSDGPLGPWPPYTPGDRATMVLDRRPGVVRDRSAERLGFWSAQRPATPTLGATGAGR